jgi:hypothetical protein
VPPVGSNPHCADLRRSIATPAASTCDYAPTASPTSPTSGPWSTSSHATNHATPRSMGAVRRLTPPRLWRAAYQDHPNRNVALGVSVTTHRRSRSRYFDTAPRTAVGIHTHRLAGHDTGFAAGPRSGSCGGQPGLTTPALPRRDVRLGHGLQEAVPAHSTWSRIWPDPGIDALGISSTRTPPRACHRTALTRSSIQPIRPR